jgi:hypothetical protein
MRMLITLAALMAEAMVMALVDGSGKKVQSKARSSGVT